MQFSLPGRAGGRTRIFAWLTAVPLGAVLLAAALQAPGKPASALVNCSPATGPMDSAELEVLALMNAERAIAGKAPLKASTTLGRAAAWKSEDPSGRPPAFSHTDSLGRSHRMRMQECGYPWGAGENIAIGYFSPAGVVDAWMNSPLGHREAILNGSFLVAGVGYFNGAWTVNFGMYDDSGNTAEPTTAPASPTIPTATSTSTPTKVPATATPTQLPPTPTATPTQPPQHASELTSGFNLVTFAGDTRTAAAAFQPLGPSLEAAYRWDAANASWQRYLPGAPDYATSLSTVATGDVLFLDVAVPATWAY